MFGRFLKFLIALALIPLVAAEVWTLIDLARAAAPTGQYHATWFLSFVAGLVVWFLIFLFLPRTMWLYVLGHEFTHALAAMLAGGKVTAFKVTSTGGHVMTDRVNWWIALSPYFVPIYALIWIGLWITIDFYHPLRQWQPILFFGIGFFWSFHLTFTWSMLHPRQTDLSGEGYIFSGVIIALMNCLGFLLLFSLLAHNLALAGHLFLHNAGQSYVWAWSEILLAIGWAQTAWSNHRI
jgi:hypothetical protein